MKKLHFDRVCVDAVRNEFVLGGTASTPEQEATLAKIDDWFCNNLIAVNSCDDRAANVTEGLLTAVWEAAMEGKDSFTILNMGNGNYLFDFSSEKLIRDLSVYMKG